MFDDPDEAIARVQEDIQRAQERAARMPQLREATEAVRGYAISRHRDIEVEMDHTGQVTALRIANQALTRGGTKVAADIMDLLTVARHNVQAQMLEAASGVLGADDPMLDMLRPPETGDEAKPRSSVLGW